MVGMKRGQPFFEVLNLYRNIKLDVPANTMAVYIGTIVYKHDGKRAVSVSVQDEYDQAMRELSRMNVQGLKPGSVVKRLAVVVK